MRGPSKTRKGISKRRYCKAEKYAFVKEARANPTKAERVLAAKLTSKKFPFKVRCQALIYGWIADFFIASKRLVIEVDGSFHDHPEQQAKDTFRDATLLRRGLIKTIRFSNDEVLRDSSAVAKKIEQRCSELPSFASWNARSPARLNARSPARWAVEGIWW